MTYGELLRTHRKKANLTIERVANGLGISVPYLSDVERGARGAFGADRTVALAKILGCDWRPLVKAALAEREPGLWDMMAEADLERPTDRTEILREATANLFLYGQTDKHHSFALRKIVKILRPDVYEWDGIDALYRELHPADG